jgi:Acetylornithine deacetylase/Succinyl-diaminopimelate desuccinylase and related deacylases
MTDVVSLAAELLAIQSTTGSEGSIVDFVSRWLVARGWSMTLQEVSRGRANVWASHSGGGVTLSTHLDTVPPYVPPRLEGTRLYGRGSSDAKGIAAAMLVAADRLASAGEKRIDLLFVVGEEKGSDGARAANNLRTRSRFLINGEPTESKLASGAKGSLRVTLRTRGREAHSAYPHLGRSAIEPLIELLPTLRQLPLPSDPVLGETTLNIGTIKGGTEANVIPAHAEAEIMFRLVGEVEPIRKMIVEWAKGRADVEFGSHIPAQRFATVPGFETGPVAYTSDIPLLKNWGEPLLFGPGSIHVAHTPDEYIDVEALRASVDTYERLARTLLAR